MSAGGNKRLRTRTCRNARKLYRFMTTAAVHLTTYSIRVFIFILSKVTFISEHLYIGSDKTKWNKNIEPVFVADIIRF